MHEVLNAEIANYWGCWPLQLSSLQRDSLANSNKELLTFLTTIGLPPQVSLQVTFYSEPPKLRLTTFNADSYLVIGDDYGTSICVKISTNEVISIDLEGKLPNRFINSNIQFFLIFLKLYDSYGDRLGRANEDEAIELINEIKTKFDELDPNALTTDENWWGVILEQVEQGLL